MYHNVSNLYYSVGQFGQFGINIFQSDKRLKKEIKNTKVKALDTIKKIKIHLKYTFGLYIMIKQCRCSSVVEHNLAKVAMRVRFPSSAP